MPRVHQPGWLIVARREPERAAGIGDTQVLQTLGQGGDIARDEGQAQQRLARGNVHVRRDDLHVDIGNIAARGGRSRRQCYRKLRYLRRNRRARGKGGSRNESKGCRRARYGSVEARHRCLSK